MTFATLMLALLASSPAAEAQAKPTILDFTMAGCGPCQQMRPELKRLKDAGYPVVEVDRDRSPERCERYGVTAFPTFIIVDARGRALAKTQGFQPARQLVDLYQDARAKLAETAVAAEVDADSPADDAVPAADDTVAGADEAPLPRAPHPWETVVRIKVHGPNSIGFGSGTIIFSTPEESIILTCAHIFKLDGSRQASPRAFPRRIDIDLFGGDLTGPSHQTVLPVETVPGKAIDYDFDRDVGLISIRPGRRLAASPVAPKGYQPKVGEGLTTVGCSEGHDATAWSTRVVSPRTGGPTPAYSGTLCLSAPKQGRSGGGLYNRAGQVVGVCDFADYQGNRGFYASPESIHGLLARNDLQALYLPGGDSSRALASRSGSAARPGSDRLRARAQSPDLADAPARPKSKAITIPAPDLLGIDTPALASADRSPARAWGAPASRSAPRPTQSQAEAAEFDMAPTVTAEESVDAVAEDPAPRPKVVARGQWKAARREDVARKGLDDEEK